MESQLLAVLTATLDDNTANVKSATAQLKAAGRAPGFASCLVKIMGEQGSAAQAHVNVSGRARHKRARPPRPNARVLRDRHRRR